MVICLLKVHFSVFNYLQTLFWLSSLLFWKSFKPILFFKLFARHHRVLLGHYFIFVVSSTLERQLVFLLSLLLAFPLNIKNLLGLTRERHRKVPFLNQVVLGLLLLHCKHSTPPFHVFILLSCHDLVPTLYELHAATRRNQFRMFLKAASRIRGYSSARRVQLRGRSLTIMINTVVF